MRILKLLTLLTFICACGPAGPLSPADSFFEMREAVKKPDPGKALSLLSYQSRRSIEIICSEIRQMDENTQKAIAAKQGIDEIHIKKITPELYVLFFFIKDPAENSSAGLFAEDISGVEREGDRAEIILQKGIRLPFVKEGPYWRFDLYAL